MGSPGAWGHQGHGVSMRWGQHEMGSPWDGVTRGRAHHGAWGHQGHGVTMRWGHWGHGVISGRGSLGMGSLGYGVTTSDGTTHDRVTRGWGDAAQLPCPEPHASAG